MGYPGFCYRSLEKSQVLQVEKERIASLEVRYCLVLSVPRCTWCKSMAKPRAPSEPFDGMNGLKLILLVGVCFYFIMLKALTSLSVMFRSLRCSIEFVCSKCYHNVNKLLRVIYLCECVGFAAFFFLPVKLNISGLMEMLAFCWLAWTPFLLLCRVYLIWHTADTEL